MLVELGSPETLDHAAEILAQQAQDDASTLPVVGSPPSDSGMSPDSAAARDAVER